MPTPTRQVVLVAFDGVQLLDIVGPSDVLDAATRLLGGRGGYRMLIATPDGQPVRGSAGVRLAADMSLGQVRLRGVDTVIVGGGLQIDRVLGDPRLAPAVRRMAAGARRTCSVCTGAFVLAEAGLLEDRAATTHWAFCEELARRHPGVRVAPDRIFVRDGPVATSAGLTAGMDLALALVEEDHGPEMARTVARWTVMFLQRPGGQSQFSERLELPAGVAAPIREILDAIVAEPAGDHRLPQLARRVLPLRAPPAPPLLRADRDNARPLHRARPRRGRPRAARGRRRPGRHGRHALRLRQPRDDAARLPPRPRGRPRRVPHALPLSDAALGARR